MNRSKLAYLQAGLLSSPHDGQANFDAIIASKPHAFKLLDAMKSAFKAGLLSPPYDGQVNFNALMAAKEHAYSLSGCLINAHEAGLFSTPDDSQAIFAAIIAAKDHASSVSVALFAAHQDGFLQPTHDKQANARAIIAGGSCAHEVYQGLELARLRGLLNPDSEQLERWASDTFSTLGQYSLSMARVVETAFRIPFTISLSSKDERATFDNAQANRALISNSGASAVLVADALSQVARAGLLTTPAMANVTRALLLSAGDSAKQAAQDIIEWDFSSLLNGTATESESIQKFSDRQFPLSKRRYGK